jgi:hypothetical protein
LTCDFWAKNAKDKFNWRKRLKDDQSKTVIAKSPSANANANANANAKAKAKAKAGPPPAAKDDNLIYGSEFMGVICAS